MKRNSLKYQINNVSLLWDDSNHRAVRPCVFKRACAGVGTQGRARVFRDGQLLDAATVLQETRPMSTAERVTSLPACMNCAAAYVTKEGLKGAITVKRLVEQLGKGK